MVKKVITSVINAIFVVVFLCFLFLGIQYLLSIKPYIVMSGSMEPEIHTGSLVFVDESYEFDKVKVGDVIAFKPTEDTLVTHRVINIENGFIETKGDNNDVSDGFSTNKDNFIGLSKYWMPKAGYLFKWIQSSRGIIISVTIMACLMILDIGLSDDDKKSKNSNRKSENKSDLMNSNNGSGR